MFRRIGFNTIRRVSYVTKPQFNTSGVKSRKWIPYTIFGASFISGWLVTQHMTFTDFMAYWRYDKLPQDSKEIENYKNELTTRAENLAVVKQMKQAGYIEVFPKSNKQEKLINKSLNSPGAIAIPPRFYHNPSTKDTVGVYHLGMKLTGYPFIVHGGILATVMEDLMREGVKIVKSKEGEKTKELSLSYKMPTFANQFVIVRTTNVETNGKTVTMSADIMDQSGNRQLVKGKGTFTV